jgi:glycosyltransferase involved in cell wall biosynthesis
LKILTVIYSLDKGGVARTAVTQAAAYSRLGAESRVLVTTERGPREADLADAGIHCWFGLDEPTLREIIDWDPAAVHIHSHSFGETEMAVLDRIFEGRTLIEKNIFSRPVPWTHRMDFIDQLSTWCAWRFCNYAPDLAHKALIVPNGADTAAFVRAPEEAVQAFLARHQIPADALVVGRIGQHYETKWSPVLINAFNWLANKHPALHLLLINPSKPVRTQAAASRFSSRITLIDKLIGDPALCEAYSAMDVFALAADQGESFGNVLAEAMLCEVPIVTLSTPWQDNSQGEVVGHNIGGLVTLTPKGFRRAIDVLLKDPSLRTRLGRAGRQRVIERFDSLKAARADLDALNGKHRPLNRKELDRQIVGLYSDAFERPSPLTLLFIRKGLLRLTRYTTHYWPIRKLPAELLKTLFKKTGRK